LIVSVRSDILLLEIMSKFYTVSSQLEPGRLSSGLKQIHKQENKKSKSKKKYRKHHVHKLPKFDAQLAQTKHRK